MTSIRRGATTSVALLLSMDVSSWPIVVVSCECAGQTYNFTGGRLTFLPVPQDVPDELKDGVIVRVTLTQSETLMLGSKCTWQVRAVSADGAAVSSDIISARVSETLNQEVLA